jgi:hypothetical protein
VVETGGLENRFTPSGKLNKFNDNRLSANSLRRF